MIVICPLKWKDHFFHLEDLEQNFAREDLSVVIPSPIAVQGWRESLC